jgi:hypothetical protein
MQKRSSAGPAADVVTEIVSARIARPVNGAIGRYGDKTRLSVKFLLCDGNVPARPGA